MAGPWRYERFSRGDLNAHLLSLDQSKLRFTDSVRMQAKRKTLRFIVATSPQMGSDLSQQLAVRTLLVSR